MANEKGYRPSTLDELSTQPKIQKMLRIYIQAARIKHDTLDHVIITGPSGCGKSTTAYIIANELGTKLKVYSGPAIKDQDDLTEILTGISQGDVIFIDEIHRINKKCQELLYFAMEQFEADVNIDGCLQRIPLPHFTLIGATNLYGGLNDAMLNRFPIQLKLAPYSNDAMSVIVSKAFNALNVDITPSAAKMVAGCTRGVPRNANSYVRRIHDVALVMNDGKVDEEVVRTAFDLMDINEYGLNGDDMRYLRILGHNTKAVGVDAIALMMNTDKATVETKIEPYLLQQGFIHKTPRGRILSEKGREIL